AAVQPKPAPPRRLLTATAHQGVNIGRRSGGNIARRLTALLDREIAGVADALPVPEPAAAGVVLKAFEDMLDAVVCAWVGTRVVAGAAVPFGNDDAAIWVPSPTERSAVQVIAD
uniref:DUF429 domain-containing protein n=1 Tax=Bosea sp. MMO-172 TaxID=3127885 RepID=UPI003019E4F7